MNVFENDTFEGAKLDAIDCRMIGPGGPFELIEFAEAGGFKRDFRNGPHTLVELFGKMERWGERPFLDAGDEQLTFGEFMVRSRIAASSLQRRGLQPGDRMILALPDGVAWLTAFAGAVLCGASVVMAPLGLFGSQPDLQMPRCVLSLSEVEQWAAWLAGAEAQDFVAVPRPGPRDEALIAFTSGTSGPPKPVRIDHRGIMAGVQNMMLGAALANQRRLHFSGNAGRTPPCVLLTAPFSHLSGYGQFLLMGLLGGRLIAPSRWCAAEVLMTIRKQGVRTLQGLLPEMAEDMLAKPVDPIESVAIINFYGAPPSFGLVQRLKAIFPNLETGLGYGLTETNGSVAVACEEDLRRFPNTAGRLSPATDIRIVGPRGNDAPPATAGEIWLRGPMLARGYGFEDQSSPAFENGWLKTGDFGWVDNNRFLHLRERDGETIQSGQSNLSFLRLEQAAQAHAGVRDAAAFGVDHADGGQRPCLAVVLAIGCCQEEIAVWASRTLDAPDLRLLVVDSIARTASGKIDRRALARLGLRQEEGVIPS